MANYQIKLVLRPELVLRSSSHPKSKVTQCTNTVSQCCLKFHSDYFTASSPSHSTCMNPWPTTDLRRQTHRIL